MPIIVSLGLAAVFIDDTFYDHGSQGQHFTPAVGVLAVVLLAAFLAVRHFLLPIPRGGFFWQMFCLFAAIMAGDLVRYSMPSVVTGLVVLTTLVGLHTVRLFFEVRWASRRARKAEQEFALMAGVE